MWNLNFLGRSKHMRQSSESSKFYPFLLLFFPVDFIKLLNELLF